MAEQLGTERLAVVEQNPFGFLTSGYESLGEKEKIQRWKAEGGREIDGTVGEVRRFVRGVRDTSTASRSPSEKRTLARMVSNTEGDGVYATTNPKLAAEEYGPCLAVVDVALGREASPDNSSVLNILDKVKGPIRAASASYVAVILLFEILSLAQGMKPHAAEIMLTASTLIPLLGQGIPFQLFQRFSEYDSLTVKPHTMPTVLSKIKQLFKGIRNVNFAERHERWVVVKDSKRVKVVSVYNSYGELINDPTTLNDN